MNNVDPEVDFLRNSLFVAKSEFLEKGQSAPTIFDDYFHRSLRGEVGGVQISGAFVKGFDGPLLGAAKSIDSFVGVAVKDTLYSSGGLTSSGFAFNSGLNYSGSGVYLGFSNSLAGGLKYGIGEAKSVGSHYGFGVKY